MSCLIEPAACRLIRKPDEAFISSLKTEMKLNPTSDVAPIVALAVLQDGEKFDTAHPQSYKYETIGAITRE